MIVSWMLSALMFSAFIGLAAASADSVARALGRPARRIWSTALAVATLWPLVASLAALAVPRIHEFAASLPAVHVLSDGAALLDRSRPETLQVVGRILLAAWALASGFLTFRLLRAIISLHRIRAGAEHRVLDGERVLISDRHGPATIGFRRHAVIVPRSLLELEEPLRRLVLRHEREHCAARDPALMLGAAMAVVMFPWNAAVWFLVRRLHLALEIDCDARVLAGGVDPNRYGRLLLWIAQRRAGVLFAPMFAAPPSHLERRIIAMRPRLTRPRAVHLAASGALLVLGIAGACSAGVPDATSTQRTAQQLVTPGLSPKIAEAPYFEFQVEQAVRQLPGTGSLKYPAAMRHANREGEVLAQFVVSENGTPELDSFKVLKSSDAAFTDAVRTALPAMRFSPARIGGAAVRQLVQQPFTFSLSRT
ncbi:MAG: M56 family metallopeptidase [bacterium]